LRRLWRIILRSILGIDQSETRIQEKLNYIAYDLCVSLSLHGKNVIISLVVFLMPQEVRAFMLVCVFNFQWNPIFFPYDLAGTFSKFTRSNPYLSHHKFIYHVWTCEKTFHIISIFIMWNCETSLTVPVFLTLSFDFFFKFWITKYIYCCPTSRKCEYDLFQKLQMQICIALQLHFVVMLQTRCVCETLMPSTSCLIFFVNFPPKVFRYTNETCWNCTLVFKESVWFWW
jgi:hypothetical protein